MGRLRGVAFLFYKRGCLKLSFPTCSGIQVKTFSFNSGFQLPYQVRDKLRWNDMNNRLSSYLRDSTALLSQQKGVQRGQTSLAGVWGCPPDYFLEAVRNCHSRPGRESRSKNLASILDFSSRIRYWTSFAGMTKGLRKVVFLDSLV